MLRIHRTKLSQSKFSWMSWLGLVGTVSCCALILVFGFMLFPSLPQVVDAADWQPGIEQKPASDASVSISLPASIDFESVTPTPDGATTTATADLTVTTTNSASYSLYLYSSDGDNSLKPKISSLANISKINATAGDVGLTLSSLEPNTWGYNLGTEAPTDSTTYSAVPTDNSTPIQTKDTSSTNSANDTYTLSFGAKVDTAIPSGTYSNTLMIAVVAEPAIIPVFGITNMQDMTSEICQNAEIGDTDRLTDTRDGKQYWVAKLDDGNCWMTQNLDLDISVSGLSSIDSDINTDDGVWNANSTYPPMATEKNGVVTNASDNTGTYSWDFGLYVKTDPDNYDAYCREVKTLSGCNGWQDVSNMVPMAESRTDGVVVSGNTYDAHYLTGNYYQWNAATAGSGGTFTSNLTSGTAQSSICPKGWRLPTGDSSGEFQTLLGNTNQYTITQSPYFYVPAGDVQGGSLSSPGRWGYWNSSTATVNGQYPKSYNLYFYYWGVYPSQTNDPYRGRLVRCIAR